jgi:hypothetical protein
MPSFKKTVSFEKIGEFMSAALFEITCADSGQINHSNQSTRSD